MPPPPQQWPVPNKLFLAAYPTPNNSDFYLYRHEDTKGVGYVSPIHGDPVPEADRNKYPNHFCTKIAPNAQAGDGWVTVIYASKLAPQDDDNYDIEYPEGVNAFPTITRTYIYLRSEYALSGPLAVGTADPGVLPDGTAQFPDAILSEAEKMVEGTGDPLIDSLFVKVTRKFQHIPNLGDTEDLAAAKTFGYKVEYPYGVLAYPRVSWKIPCDAETAVTPLSGVCPIPGYTGSTYGDGTQALLAIDQSYQNDKGKVVGLLRTYECNPGPIIVETDFEPRTGTPVKITKQIVASSSIPATVALLNAEINGYGTVALTSIVNGLGTTSSVHGLSVGQEIYLSGATLGVSAAFINGDASGLGAYFVKTVPTTTTFTFAATTNGSAFAAATDDATGGTLNKRTLARGSTIEYKPMGMDGLRSIKVTSSIDLSAIDYLQGAADTVYYGSANYSFPDVLTAAEFGAAESIAANGVGWDFNAVPVFVVTEGYRGPCLARITERYTSNPASPAFLASIPTPTSIRGGTGTVGYVATRTTDTSARALARVWNVPNSLHAAITMTHYGVPVDVDDVIWATSIAATNPTTTPTGWLVADVNPELWKFGIWVYRITEIIHP